MPSAVPFVPAPPWYSALPDPDLSAALPDLSVYLPSSETASEPDQPAQIPDCTHCFSFDSLLLLFLPALCLLQPAVPAPAAVLPDFSVLSLSVLRFSH